MRIVDVKATVVELSGTGSVLEIVPVPDPHHRLRPSMLPDWGAQLDWDYIRKRTIAEF